MYFNPIKFQVIHLQGGCLPDAATTSTSNEILESHWTLEDFAFYCKNWWSYYQDSQLFIKRTWALRALLERRMKIFSSIYQTGRHRWCCCQYQSHRFRVQNNTALLSKADDTKGKGFQQELHEWSGIWKECLLNLLTIFIICQENSWLYYINPYKWWFFQIP